MSMNIKITTKGVQGAPMLLNEFISNIPRIAGGPPLDSYAANVSDQMQADAPVLTGYLRNNIQSYRVSPTEVRVVSWAPYSGPAEIRSHRPHFFEKNTFASQQIGAHLIGDASVQYLRFLVNKYQNRP